MKTKKAAYGKPQRLKFPADEAANTWLGYAFDAYYRADVGVAKGIQQEERKGRTLAHVPVLKMIKSNDSFKMCESKYWSINSCKP